MTQVDAATAPTPEDASLFLKLKTWIIEDKGHWVSSGWWQEAKEAYDFVAGHGQWTQAERTALESPDGGSPRVPITMNMVQTYFHAVAGMEINNRHDTVYLPRGNAPGPVKKSELLSAASEFIAKECGAQKRQSRAFQDAVKTGLGFIESRLDYDEDPDGKYIEDRISPLEMLVDCNARDDNLSDARRMTHIKSKIPIVDARAMFPDAVDEDLDASWIELDTGAGGLRPEEVRKMKLENSLGPTEQGTVTLVRIQWWEREPYYKIVNPQNPQQTADVSPDQYKQLSARFETDTGMKLNGVPLNRRVYKQAWLGSKLLKVEPAPCKDHFSWTVITGAPDENKGVWYGMVRVAKDPQKWLNKWLTNALHMFNTTAKGGLLMEESAVDDIAEFNRTYAQPDIATQVRDGAISGNKVIPKPGAAMVDNQLRLTELAMSFMPRAIGISIEQLGLRDANQAGVLEQMRKQSTMTIMAPMFDGLRQARLAVGKKRLYFIQHYLADGRFIRVLGENGMEYRALLKDEVSGKYDVEVEEAPTSPDVAEANLRKLGPLFMSAWENQQWDIVAILLPYMMFPADVTEKMMAHYQKMKADPQMQAEQQAQKQIAQQGAVAKVEKDKASAAQGFASAERDQVGALVDLLQAGISVTRERREQINPQPQEAAGAPT